MIAIKLYGVHIVHPSHAKGLYMSSEGKRAKLHKKTCVYGISMGGQKLNCMLEMLAEQSQYS